MTVFISVISYSVQKCINRYNRRGGWYEKNSIGDVVPFRLLEFRIRLEIKLRNILKDKIHEHRSG